MPAAGGGGMGGEARGGSSPMTGGMGGVSGSAGGATAGSAGAAGGGGQQGEKPPEGVPEDYTLQLDLPFKAQGDLSTLLAGNQNGWMFDAADGGSLAFNGAGYTAPPPVNESLSSFAVISSTKFGSFVLDVELQQTNPDTNQPHRDLCIVFNAADHKHFFYAHIAATHDERSHNIHVIDNAPRAPITATNSGGIQWGPPGTWHKLRLMRDASAGNIAVYLDGKNDDPILTASSTKFTTGYIGFGTFQDGGKVRSLKVWTKTSEKVATTTFFD
jgi:hypothetical protein